MKQSHRLIERLESRALFSSVVAGTEAPLAASAGNWWGIDGPQVGSDAQGNFVTAWVDGNNKTWAQVFNPDGTTKTGPIRLADDFGVAVTQPLTIAVAGNGNFVVTWWNANFTLNQNNAEAQFFKADGTPLTGEVALTTKGGGMFPVAAMDDKGDSVLVWDKGGGGFFSIVAQRFDPTGKPVGRQLVVSNGSGNQMYPSAAMDGAGDFVVTWAASDGSGNGVFAQRYSSSGAKLGNTFRVNTTTAGDQAYGRAAMDRAGDFAVVWAGQGFDGATGIYGQRYNASGQPLPSMDNPSIGEFHVDLASGGTTLLSSNGTSAPGFIAMDRSSPAFVVAWDQTNVAPVAQAFDATGARIGVAFQVSSSGAGSTPEIVYQPGNQFTIIWTDTDGLHKRNFGIV